MYKFYKTKNIDDDKGWGDGRNYNWRYIPLETISIEEMNYISDSLKAKGFTKIFPSDGHRLITSCQKMVNAYFVEEQKNYIILRWAERWEEDGRIYECPHQVRCYPSMKTEEVKHSGTEAFNKARNVFKSIHKVDILEAYSGDLKSTAYLRRLIKECVPPPVNYGYKDPNIINHMYAADVKSCYPYESSKDLPTLVGLKIIEGYAEPTEEYPFAFYLKSHHIKIYGELDTRNFIKFSRWYNTEKIYKDLVKDEKTLLLKKSTFPIKNVMDHFFDMRQESEESNKKYKAYMNLFVGTMHMNARPLMPHDAAVILARAAWRILNEAKKIEDDGNVVRLIATDAVFWEGKRGSYTTKSGKIGSFSMEEEDCKMLICGPKKYQILTKDGRRTTKWAGKSKQETKLLEFGCIFDMPHIETIIVYKNDRLEEEIVDMENFDWEYQDGA